MYEQLVYRNHVGETLEFGKNGIFVNENELHDYEWDYAGNNGRVSNFTKGIKKIKVPVVIACPDEDQGVKAINNLMEYAEKDILAEKAGRLIVGDYYLECYIVGSKKKKYSGKRGFIKADLTVVSSSPFWINENTTVLNKAGSAGKNLDYPHGFPYDFTPFGANKKLVNPSFAPTDFNLKIFGACTNPNVYIGGHSYAVAGSAGANEYIEVNSKEKTVYLVKADGTKENFFSKRNKESYIFEKIPSGENAVLWEGDYSIEITLYEERSEPKWI